MHSDTVTKKNVHCAFQFFLGGGDISHKMVIVLDTRGHKPMDFFPRYVWKEGKKPQLVDVFKLAGPRLRDVC